MVTSSKTAYAKPKSAAPRALVPVAVHCWPVTPQETLKHSSVLVSVGSLGPGAHKFVWALWAHMVGMGFDSKHEFVPPTILLGLLLCPWTCSISSEPFQHLLSYWGFSDFGCGVSFLGQPLLRAVQPPAAAGMGEFNFSSVQSVVSDSLRPHESQHARPACPSPTPRDHSDSRPSSQWCRLAISSSVVPFSSCPQFLPASESSSMSQLFAWGDQSTGVSALASFLPKKSQGWSPSEWTGWITLQSKGLSRI